MPANVQLFCGPAGAGKTERLLKRYREVARATPGAALWIAPSQRSVDALRRRMLGDGVCLLAPNLLTFQDFVEELIRANDAKARPISDLQRRLLIDDLVVELGLKKELSHFEGVIDTRGFAEGVFALFAELKRNEVWPDLFAQAAASIDGDRRKEQQCARLYAAYQQRLIEQNLYDVEGRFWYARDLLTRGERRPFEHVRAVFCDGFASFTRTQHEILATLGGSVEEIWIAIPDDPADQREELFRMPRATSQRFRQAFERLKRLAPARSPSQRPAGLVHMERQLFRPLRAVVRADKAEGLHLIRAPGELGEARLVARAIKEVLLQGVPAGDIVVSMRDVSRRADLLREVFAEYGIPIDVEGAEPLGRHPAVATLLRALRLPEDDWPFRGVTALLRSSWFRPEWPEMDGDPMRPQHAEVLLRLLGLPRGRDVYLKAVDRWAKEPPPALEDEEAEEARRQRTHKLAGTCAAFLRRFFQAWDGAPPNATLAEHVAWVRRFAADLGISARAAATARDAAALQCLWDELDAWVALEDRLAEGMPRNRTQFTRMLGTLAALAGLPRSPRGPGRVRILSAELACELETPYLFVMGLGERSFPDLSAAEPVFDESERQGFQRAGLDLQGSDDRLPAEMLLFYRLVTRARKQLVVSYPAVDDKGQDLLPSTFLTALLDCFETVPVTHRRMLIQEYETQVPYSPAEFRVQLAVGTAARPALRPGALPPELLDNLAAAAAVAQRRQDKAEFSPYDGRLRHAAVSAILQDRCGPLKKFSPTALETYVTCPFRFLLQNVLRLQALDEPSEEIEHTRRGLAFHRALSRLHIHLKHVGIHAPIEEVGGHVERQLNDAVAEYAKIAPSLAARVLWEIEGKRLQRSARKYVRHWREFVGPWHEQGVAPRPERFEEAFGLSTAQGQAAPLVLNHAGVEVRLGGRIDRVDFAEVDDGIGFWIIDYKTGKGTNYDPKDLREFRRLQLMLYALAVQEVLLAGQAARPLGLAYWLVTDCGPKQVMPAKRHAMSWLGNAGAWREVQETLRGWVARLVGDLRQGEFVLQPRDEDCTNTCDFAEVCRIGASRLVVEGRPRRLELPVLEAEQTLAEDTDS